MNKEKIQWKTEQRNVDDLIGAEYNPRKSSEQEERDLESSIEEFGTVIPIVINIGKRNNVIIGGHFRVRLYKKKGIKKVDVMVPNRELTITEEKRLNLRLNKNTGSWDPDKLRELELTLLLDVGFDDEDLQVFFDDVEMIDDTFNVPKAIKEIKTPKTRPGDVWQLGDHMVMCGDSTEKDDVAKLMGKELADVIYCDPPYNIGLDYNKGISTDGKYGGQYGGHTRREGDGRFPDLKYKGMKMTDSKKVGEYAKFIDLTIKNALEYSKPNNHIFYWCDEIYIWLMQTLFKDNKISNKRVCLWVKNNFNMTPQIAFNKCYEPCVYGVTGKPYLNTNIRNLNEILNKEIESGNQVHDEILDMITLWIQKRDNANEYEHPTQKPITLAEKPLKRCSAPGHVVLDLFGGSGSTLLACEQLKRKARLMEQDPVFCDVIVKRWEEWTNQKAKKI